MLFCILSSCRFHGSHPYKQVATTVAFLMRSHLSVKFRVEFRLVVVEILCI